jgi:DNA-binding NarL/FixJ family response regulator
MSEKWSPLPTYVLADNQLAGEYIIQILMKDRQLRPATCNELPQSPTKRTVVFIFEGLSGPFPLRLGLRRMALLFPSSKFIVVDGRRPDDELMRLIAAGVHGFVEHRNVNSELSDAVCAVAQGHYWISDALLHGYIEGTAAGYGSCLPGSRITQTEGDVFELVRRRFSNKEIAELLGIRESTVKFHLSNIFGKYQVASRQELERAHDSSLFWKRLLALPTRGEKSAGDYGATSTDQMILRKGTRANLAS